MSRTEFHTGKLIPVTIETTLVETCVDIAYEHSVTLSTIDDNWKEDFMDEFGEWSAKRHNRPEYFIYKNSLYRVADHKEYEEFDTFMDLSYDEKGNIYFIGQFYNGGTYFGEMLEESLDRLTK